MSRVCLTAFSRRRGEAFATLEALAEDDARFDLVICDPPAFAPNRKALEPGLRAYERLARLSAPLVSPRGYLVLCSCSHAADLAAFRSACTRGIGRAGRQSHNCSIPVLLDPTIRNCHNLRKAVT
jgi:23S rRNA (cytosine1962-C5)-methyltransferase